MTLASLRKGCVKVLEENAEFLCRFGVDKLAARGEIVNKHGTGGATRGNALQPPTLLEEEEPAHCTCHLNPTLPPSSIGSVAWAYSRKQNSSGRVQKGLFPLGSVRDELQRAVNERAIEAIS